MISVAMTTYNGEKYLSQQLDSIMNQTVKVDEIIVCDDNSSDETVNILHQYPVTVIQNSVNLGFKANFKKALEHCHGEYIFLCDQDDVWMHDKVEKMMSIMENTSGMHALASSFDYVDSNGKKIETKLKPRWSNNNLYPREVADGELVEVPFQKLLYANFFQGACMLIDKETAKEFINCFEDTVPHDWLMNVYASLTNGMYFYNIPLVQYRIHSENTLGIPQLDTDLGNHVQRSSTLKIRLQYAEGPLHILQALQKNKSEFYITHEKDFDSFEFFLKKHIQVMENKRLFPLLLQNFNPWYKKIESWRARLMDILYVISH